MTRPKIKTALPALFTAIAIVLTIFSAFALNRMAVIDQSTADIAGDLMPSLGLAKEADNAFTDYRLGWRNHVIARSPERISKVESALAESRSRFTKALDSYDAMGPTAMERAITAGLRSTLAGYDLVAEKLRKASDANDDDECERLLFEEMTPISAKVDQDLSKLIEFNEKGAAEAYTSSQEVYSLSIKIAVALLSVAALIVAGAIWYAFVGIAKPIENITQSMKNLAGGDAESAIPYPGRQDEIGEMAAAVGVFRSNALDNRRLEQETSAQRHQSEEQQRRAAEQDRVRAEAMAQATSGLADGLKQLSAGNLSFQLSQPFAADFESLRADFNMAVEQLRGTLGAVSQATSSIDSGSREVSQSADDLAKRTEQQAASLEETAAALDQITANVSNSSKRAEEARTVAIQANESARHSGAVVANAVDAMGKIEQSSSQISSIISVIDEIAFQTNLLALNAGVEAARAGEAGKGFAVVAQEVRELAQRSAKAAKEIKDLIRNSSVDVESGVKLVSETGDALKTIEGYIVTINQHMDSIATSAREQSVGLSEVNTAVNQMDQVTQQNAAMVEEANAAGATLANEAARLRELIGRFDLGAGASLSQSNQLRRTAQVMAASPQSRPAASPARSMVGKIAQAFTGRSSAAAAPSAAADSWEEF
ncbi:methyl-accepting chemotaxis protein [Rhizobium deserti]|uniref:Methyl-accepting chemotaxis protein n=1 Tax=Rhizobium deserti TaxID=2547961 RepID=A0A4R5U6K6_9HYPH|nr:methyl-accepting chemotaxis protein [Rhizobium deserti]TDK29808.1 methyl-accepting chemotaxis protein [Rhizobium deserti]